MPQFPSFTFPSNIAFGDGTSRQESQTVVNTTTHHLVNRILEQMAPSTHIEDKDQDFLQLNTLVESYAFAPVSSHLTHLKMETYDGSIDPTQHMMMFTSYMYVYNASDSICCRMFPSSLTRKFWLGMLMYYFEASPNLMNQERNLFKISSHNPLSILLKFSYLLLDKDLLNQLEDSLPDSIRLHKKYPIYQNVSILKFIDMVEKCFFL